MNTHFLNTSALEFIFGNLVREQRATLEADPITLALLPLLDMSHRELLTASTSLSKEEALRQMSLAVTEADAAHDGQATLAYQLIQAAVTGAGLEDDSNGARELARISDVLFPDGLNQVRKSYLQEATEAPQHFASLNDAQRARLAAIRYGDSTALDTARRWVAAAEALGDLVRARGILESSDAAEAGGVDRRATRFTALKRLNLLLYTIEHTTLTANQQVALRDPIERLVAEHERRAASGANPNGASDDVEQANGSDGEVAAAPESTGEADQAPASNAAAVNEDGIEASMDDEAPADALDEVLSDGALRDAAGMATGLAQQRPSHLGL